MTTAGLRSRLLSGFIGHDRAGMSGQRLSEHDHGKYTVRSRPTRVIGPAFAQVDTTGDMDRSAGLHNPPIVKYEPSAGMDDLRSAALRESPAHCRAESAIGACLPLKKE